MLPWNYGFHWSAGNIVFLGAFYAVLLVVTVTLIKAAGRTLRNLRANKAEAIRWHSDFAELHAYDRSCRHVFTGEFESRTCPNAFDCRECATHAKLAGLRTDQTQAGEDEILGMEFPLDRFYHRGHTWVRREADGLVTIGLDDLGSRLLDKPERLELPEPGENVTVNGTAWRAQKRGAEVRVLSPLNGEVVETGGPGSGFYLKLKTDNFDVRHLLCGAEVRPWVMRELERLQLTLSTETGAPALADGGVPVADISAICPEPAWDTLCGKMFLNA